MHWLSQQHGGAGFISISVRKHKPRCIKPFIQLPAHEKVRVLSNNKSPEIAPDFCSNSRRSGWCIRFVFTCRGNAEVGPKDKQDRGIYFFHGPKGYKHRVFLILRETDRFVSGRRQSLVRLSPARTGDAPWPSCVSHRAETYVRQPFQVWQKRV